MMFPSGQPLWQKGMPQSMQRAPWVRRTSSGVFSSNSRQCLSRVATGSLCTFSRSNSRKPVILPIVRTRQTAARRAASVSRCCFASTLAYSTGMTFTNCFCACFQSARSRAATPERVRPWWRWTRSWIVVRASAGRGGPDRPRAEIAAGGEGAVVVQHVGAAAAHARREVASRAAEHHHDALGHVLAAVVSDALHHGGDAAVAHAESLPRLATQ